MNTGRRNQRQGEKGEQEKATAHIRHSIQFAASLKIIAQLSSGAISRDTPRVL
jgi:hypothetical protein